MELFARSPMDWDMKNGWFSNLGHIVSLLRQRRMALIVQHQDNVHWAGIGEINIGPFIHPHTEQSIQTFLQFLDDAGLQPRWEEMDEPCLWNKMLLNIAINPIAGLLGKENGALLEPALFESAVGVLLEGQ